MNDKNNTHNTEERLPAMALIWMRSADDPRAPDALGGHTVKAQETAAMARAQHDGVPLHHISHIISDNVDDAEQRLDAILHVLQELPADVLLTSAEVFTHDSDDDAMKLHLMLHLRGTRLVLCDP
ncbi:hypothetical protein GCM10010922_03020 [Microbacterium sorbitolivorans]|uniref:Uncharacterized protein n=1 Tax=Microbacterium sorbitolivorans TaxID=1867410 RepID=A0A367Y6P1_9MICO|nr:hypothetical protein [Microbacterium sorbitolivorans]RCK61535.1 hypothetical protein DTO57_02555 [Microbacterium sorbitolivorans]GGF31369.1 hypothetical protein GCM10010922_03020 [Microbacterium sorbitolivorans]